MTILHAATLKSIAPDFLQSFFASNRDLEGWRAVADNWSWNVMGWAAIVAVFALLTKALIKKFSRVEKKGWTLKGTVGYALLGWALLALVLLIVFFSVPDFRTIMGFSGYIKGAFVVGAIVYLLIALAVHAILWRDDLRTLKRKRRG